MTSPLDQRYDSFATAPFLVAFALFCLMYFGAEVASIAPNTIDLTRDYRWLDVMVSLAALIAFLVFLCCAISHVLGRRFKRAISHFFASAALLFSFMFLPYSTISWIPRMKLYVFNQQYLHCEQFAIPYSARGAFKMCSARVSGPSFTVIVFDSAGEINLPAPQQSDAFKTFMNDQSPLFTECDHDVRLIKSHFYLVRAICG